MAALVNYVSFDSSPRRVREQFDVGERLVGEGPEACVTDWSRADRILYLLDPATIDSTKPMMKGRLIIESRSDLREGLICRVGIDIPRSSSTPFADELIDLIEERTLTDVHVLRCRSTNPAILHRLAERGYGARSTSLAQWIVPRNAAVDSSLVLKACAAKVLGAEIFDLRNTLERATNDQRTLFLESLQQSLRLIAKRNMLILDDDFLSFTSTRRITIDAMAREDPHVHRGIRDALKELTPAMVLDMYEHVGRDGTAFTSDLDFVRDTGRRLVTGTPWEAERVLQQRKTPFHRALRRSVEEVPNEEFVVGAPSDAEWLSTERSIRVADSTRAQASEWSLLLDGPEPDSHAPEVKEVRLRPMRPEVMERKLDRLTELGSLLVERYQSMQPHVVITDDGATKTGPTDDPAELLLACALVDDFLVGELLQSDYADDVVRLPYRHNDPRRQDSTRLFNLTYDAAKASRRVTNSIGFQSQFPNAETTRLIVELDAALKASRRTKRPNEHLGSES